MADQRPWFKLWCTCLTDPDLQNLSLDNWARWVRLGVYTKLHGTRGKIIFKAPFTALFDLFQLHSMTDITAILVSFPHLELRNDDPALQIEMEFKNWHKYQVDSSSQRVKRFRDKRNALEEKRSRGEREESDSVSFERQKPLKGPYGG